VTGKPDRIASPLQIMIDGPLGGAAFNNEFGRANLGGYFRVYEQNVGGTVRGYHKPIMIAGGIGNIDARTRTRTRCRPALADPAGRPGMRIGMGGGAASSMATGTNTADLDFDSVQRGNPEMERRAQEVINACWQLGDENPILSIHDVGAGGISNAFPELVDGADRGARFDLRRCTWKSRACRLPRSGATSRKSATCWRSRRTDLPLPGDVRARAFAVRRGGYRNRGEATPAGRRHVDAALKEHFPVNMPMDVLLGKPPRMHRDVTRVGGTPAGRRDRHLAGTGRA
jgi:phosphoribosylformylglycinamidine synthase